MDIHIVHQSAIEFKEAKNKWKSRWAILEKSERNAIPEEVDQENMRHSLLTSLVIRKSREGEVRLAIPLYYLCVVDKYMIDKKNYGITLVVANKHTNTAETYQIQCETVAATDVWLDYFNGIVGAGMHKFEIKLPKVIKGKYNGPGWLYFYEEQKFITITTDSKVPQYFGTWPIQLLRRYGGDDPNKFVFESGRRCFGGVNIYQVASSQAYDIRTLCNKVSSSTRGGGALLSAAVVGYADTEPRYRSYPAAATNARTRVNERPVTVVSNGSITSNTSKGSNRSSTGESARQMSLDRNGNTRPMSDTIDSGISFRSSNNSILSNRSSRGSYSSDMNLNDQDLDSGVDTLDSCARGLPPPPLPLSGTDHDPQDMYMVMTPGGVATPSTTGATTPNSTGMAPISEAGSIHGSGEDFGGGLYETMHMGQEQLGYTTLRNGGIRPTNLQTDAMSNYMVPKPSLHHLNSTPHSPMSPLSGGPASPMGVRHVNYPAHAVHPVQPIQQTPSPCDNYMNMGSYNTPPPSTYASPTTPYSPHSNYMNIDNIQPPPQTSSSSSHSNYMNIDMLSRSLEKSASLDAGAGGFAQHRPVTAQSSASYGNYMNMPTIPDTPPASQNRKAVVPAPIYDTPTNHLRSYANVDNKCIAMSVSNPIYGNCAPAQKLQT